MSTDRFPESCAFVARFVGPMDPPVWRDMIRREHGGHVEFSIYGIAERCDTTTAKADKVLNRLTANQVIERITSTGSQRKYKINAGANGVPSWLRQYHGGE